jgi:hypothetical protein
VGVDITKAGNGEGLKVTKSSGSGNAATVSGGNMELIGGVLTVPTGSAGAPSITFTGDTNNGIYQDGTDILAFATAGVRRARIDSDGKFRFYYSTQADTTGGFFINGFDATAGVPTYTFNDDLNTGMWSSAADVLDFSTAGTNRLSLSTSALTSTVPLSVGTSNAITSGTIELGNASDTTISRVSAGVLAVEGVTIPTISSTSALSNKTGTDATNTWINLTTTGTSGAATYTGNTLNIPQYSGGGGGISEELAIAYAVSL